MGLFIEVLNAPFIPKILAKLNQERVKNLTQSSKHQFKVVVKKDCPTCEMIESALVELISSYPESVSIYVQDDPSFPKAIESKIDDTSLEFSYKNNIEIVPTLICSIESKETNRTIGWDKSEWQKLTNLPFLGRDLDNFKPGCGSKTQEPGIEEQLAARFDEKLL